MGENKIEEIQKRRVGGGGAVQIKRERKRERERNETDIHAEKPQ